mgnify:FL=1
MYNCLKISERGKHMPKKLKNCAVINDISGYGRCSLTVSIPIISALGIRVLPVPTAVFSNHTGFSEYYFHDLTDGMEEYFENWYRLSLEFDGIYTGFLGSEHQVDIICNFTERARSEKTLLFVDPIMGDNGVLYSTYTESLVGRLRSLVSHADVITPNLTEACFLTETPYAGAENFSDAEISSLADKLRNLGAKRIVITSIRRGNVIKNFALDSLSGDRFFTSSKYISGQYSGTGDLFSSLLCGYLINGISFRRAVKKTSAFLEKAVAFSDSLGVSKTDGAAFEPLLKFLK